MYLCIITSFRRQMLQYNAESAPVCFCWNTLTYKIAREPNILIYCCICVACLIFLTIVSLYKSKEMSIWFYTFLCKEPAIQKKHRVVINSTYLLEFGAVECRCY